MGGGFFIELLVSYMFYFVGLGVDWGVEFVVGYEVFVVVL